MSRGGAAPIGSATRVRRTAAAWLLWALAIAAALVLVARTPVVTDITAFLPGPATDAQAVLAAQLRDGPAARTLLIGVQVDGASDAAEAASALGAATRVVRALAARLAADSHFAAVADGELHWFEADRDALMKVRYQISPGVTAAQFTVSGLHRAFERLAALLQSAAAPMVRPLAAADPTAELLRVLDAQGASAPATVDGVWVDPGHRIAVLLALTRAPGFDIDAQGAAMDAVRAAYSAVLAAPQPGPALPQTQPLTLQMTGPGVFAVESRAAIRRDASRLSALATGLIVVLLWFTLRSVRFLVLAAVPVASGVLIGLAAVAARYGSIHGITLGFGITLIGEAVDYAVYVHLQRVAGRVDRRLGRALALAAATSAAGFIAMLCSGFAGLEQLGLFSLVGIVVAALVAGVLLPGVLPAPRLRRLPAVLTAPPAALRRWRMPVLALAVVLAAAVLGAATLRHDALWSDALGQVSPLAPQRGDLDGRLRDALALPDLRWLVAIGADDQDAALARAEDLEPLLERLHDAGAIGGYDSPTRLLPSRRTQQLRRDALPAADELRRRMRLAIDGTPFDPQAFEPFIDAVATARDAPPVTAASFSGTLLGARLAAQLVDRRERSTVLIALRAVTDPSRLAAALRPYAPQVELIDVKSDLERLITDYRGRALTAAAAGVLAIVVLLAWRLADPLAAARIALALLAAVLVTAAIVLLGGSHLTLFHVVAMLLVVGVGSNYGLFLSQLSPDPQLRQATVASVLLCAASTTVGFGILAFAATPVLHMIGLTVGVGALVALLTTAALATGDAPAPRASTEVLP